MINYYAISVENNNTLYGPGNRVVLWTKGCSIRCKGCSNRHLISKNNAKMMASMDLVKYFNNRKDIEGLTLLGGEPSDQIKSLLPAMKYLQKQGYSIITFTGHEIEWFKSKSEREFIANSDIIICGPFIQEQQNLYLHFRGSENQRVILNSKRFKDYEVKDGINMVLLEVDKNGIIINKGFTDDKFKSILRDISNETEIHNDS